MISLLEFDVLIIVAIVGAILFSGLVHGTLGLGFPMVATPMLAAMMDVRSAILVTLLPTMAVNVMSIATSRQALETARQFHPLVIFALLGSIGGAAVLAWTDPAPFRLLLAGLILLYLWDGIRISKSWLEARPLIAMAGFGLVAGFSAGTTNVMVAILLIYFLSLETPRARLVAALNSCFLVGKISQFAVLAVAGLVGSRLLLETAPLALAAVAALLLGQRVQARIDVGTYQRILRHLLVILAIVLLLQFVMEAGWLPTLS